MTICTQIYGELLRRIDDLTARRASRLTKPDGSYVTPADVLSQEVIESACRGADENILLISEEQFGGDWNGDSDAAYLIADPLDGTENFTSGMKEWGISLAIFRSGRHVESLIGLPEMGLLLKTGQKLTRGESRLFGLSSGLTAEELRGLPAAFEYRITGCAVYNFYNVITGAFQRFENPRGAHVWDVAAGFNLALEHGLRVVVEGRDYDGEFLAPDRRYRFAISGR